MFRSFVAEMLHQTQKELFIESFASYFFGSSHIKLAARHLKDVYHPIFFFKKKSLISLR